MTGTELATRAPGGGLESKIKYAQALAAASLLPAAYRDKPANVLLAMELGESLGISSIQAINGIHVIEGKPSASADLIASLVRRAGHKLRVQVDDSGLTATAQIIRADDPDYTFTAVWNEAKARSAGLWGKGNWSKHPGQMLRNRAITEVARMGASDALYGVIYTPEELGAEVTPDGDVVVTQLASENRPPSIREAIGAAVEIPEPQPQYDVPEVPPQKVPGISEKQLKMMGALMSKLGMTDRAEALAWVHSVIGHEIASRNDLTSREATQVIDRLKKAEEDSARPDTGEVLDGELVEDWPEVAGVQA